jgi:hypothetical protein
VIAWDDKDACDTLVSALVGDADIIIGALAEDSMEGSAAQALALLAVIAGRDVETSSRARHKTRTKLHESFVSFSR